MKKGKTNKLTKKKTKNNEIKPSVSQEADHIKDAVGLVLMHN